MARFGEPSGDRRSGDGADFIDLGEFGFGGAGEGVEIGIGAGEGLGAPDSDLMNAQTDEEAPEVAGSGGMDAGDEIGGGLLTHPFEVCDGIGGEEVEVGDVADESGVDELAGDDFAAAFDVHGGASAPMFDATADAGGAIGIGAAPDDAFGITDGPAGDGRAALGTLAWEVELDLGAGTGFWNDADDGRDDFTGLFDDDDVADADVLSAEFVFVVEGGAADGGTGDEDGFEFGDGGEGAGASHLDGDAEESGLGLFRSELVGHGPARGLAGEAERVAQGDLVELHDRTVGFVAEVGADTVEFVDGLKDFVGGTGDPQAFGSGQTDGLQPAEEIGLGIGEGAPADFAEAVGHDGERALGDGAGIELFEGAGGGVAGIGEWFFAGGFAVGVELFESGGRHVDLTADFEHFGEFHTRRRDQPERQVAQGAEVGGDVVAGGAIAAGGAEGEHAGFVTERDGDAIDLGFDGPGEGSGAEGFLGAEKEGADVPRVSTCSPG